MADDSRITKAQLREAMNKVKIYTNNKIANITSATKVEPEELDMPKVFIYGSALPTTKTDVLLTMDYISNTDKFSSYIKLKCQGTSSMSFDKKNFTISMFNDEERVTKLKKNFKGWGEQSKFVLKANYVDTTHTRNLSGARIAYDMIESRPDSEFKSNLLNAPRYGLVDGFPIKLYFNGEFYGIYTWNIPKDGWMFNMDKNNPNHIVLCAEKNTDGNSSLINSCQFKKLWTNGDEGDWSVEFGTYSQTVADSLNRCINFVMTATDDEFKTNISQYFDLYSLLDYYCFSYLTCHLDGLAKNMLMVTYDGVIWGASLYDMDSIYGVQWHGNSYVATNYQCPEEYQEQFSLLWERIEFCFGEELYARYQELRQGALSLSNIIKHVEEIYDIIPDRVFADEHAKWTNLPQVSANTMTRFRNYMRDRAVYVDNEMKVIGTKIACTGITLDKNTLTFNEINKSDEVIITTYEKGFLSRSQYGYSSGYEMGEVIPNANDVTTDYIPCDNNNEFTIDNSAGGTGMGVVGYGSDKQALYVLNFDSYTWKSKEESVEMYVTADVNPLNIINIPEDVKYFRICFYTLTPETITITKKYINNSIYQTLTATVTPTNTTDRVLWSVNPTDIVVVDDGVVTPIANGNCIVTATCGDYSASCSITVEAIIHS